MSRDSIITRLWESDEFIDDNTLTVNITRLRNKLEELNLKELLETKRGHIKWLCNIMISPIIN